MDKERAYEILDDTNGKYKNLFDSGNERFITLPFWLRSHSNLLTKELEGKIRPHYNQYKRGTIIYVDFGVNIGSELSGGHFAIILNKKDSKKSSTLNVIPLTSKNKKHFLPIDKTIFDNANNILQSELRNLENDIRDKTEKINQLVIEKNELLEKARKGEHTLNNKLHEPKIGSEVDDLIRLEEELIEITKLITTIEIKIDMIDKLVLEIKNDKKDLEQVYYKYSKYNKNTFACYKAIQNISKLRVRKINKYDPSGNIKVDNNTLDKIDAKIIEEYTK